MHQPVTQEHGYGCGVACVAYALRQSYGSALRRFAHPQRAWQGGYFCKDLVAVLNAAGRRYRHCYVRPRHRSLLHQYGTIVYVQRSRRYPAGHYLIRTERGWMNPWTNFPCIHPVESGFQKRLPGRALYAIYESEDGRAWAGY